MGLRQARQQNHKQLSQSASPLQTSERDSDILGCPDDFSWQTLYFLSLTTVILLLRTHHNKGKAHFTLSNSSDGFVQSCPYFRRLTCEWLMEKRHPLWPENRAKQLALMEIKPEVTLAHTVTNLTRSQRADHNKSDRNRLSRDTIN